MNKNKILNGKGGETWVGPKKLTTVTKFSAKVKGDFEDQNFCGDPATYSIYNGYSGDGSVDMVKTDSYLWKKVADMYSTGVFEDITIYTSLKNSEGETERVAMTGVTFTEFDLSLFEAKKTVTVSFPFTFEKFQVLDTIDED